MRSLLIFIHQQFAKLFWHLFSEKKEINEGDYVLVFGSSTVLVVKNVYPDSPAYEVCKLDDPDCCIMVMAYCVEKVYLTVDGLHLAPYPGMTDMQLYEYEECFNIPKNTRTFKTAYEAACHATSE